MSGRAETVQTAAVRSTRSTPGPLFIATPRASRLARADTVDEIPTEGRQPLPCTEAVLATHIDLGADYYTCRGQDPEQLAAKLKRKIESLGYTVELSPAA